MLASELIKLLQDDVMEHGDMHITYRNHARMTVGPVVPEKFAKVQTVDGADREMSFLTLKEGEKMLVIDLWHAWDLPDHGFKFPMPQLDELLAQWERQNRSVDSEENSNASK